MVIERTMKPRMTIGPDAPVSAFQRDAVGPGLEPWQWAWSRREDDAGYEQDTWLLSKEMGSTQRGWVGGNLGGRWKRAFR